MVRCRVLFLLKEHRLKAQIGCTAVQGMEGETGRRAGHMREGRPGLVPAGSPPTAHVQAGTPRTEPGVPKRCGCGSRRTHPRQDSGKGGLPGGGGAAHSEGPRTTGCEEPPRPRAGHRRGPGQAGEVPLSPFSTRPGTSLPQPTFMRLGTGSRDTFTLPFRGTVLTSRVRDPRPMGPHVL